jgi:membrane associated rhomboid family serine protease
MFLHANWLHLIGNMWYLWVFGDNVEDRYGPPGYLGLYLLSCIAAALGQTACSPDSVKPHVASTRRQATWGRG